MIPSLNPLFTTFNFMVIITLDDDQQGSLPLGNLPLGNGPLCQAGFSQVDGLELSVENKTIRAGGDNGRQIHLGGPVNNGTLTLKRGMTSSFDLWTWFERVNLDHERHLRATTEVVMLRPNGMTEQVSFVLERCLPTKLKVPALDASTGAVAIEELAIAYETMRLVVPNVFLQAATSIAASL